MSCVLHVKDVVEGILHRKRMSATQSGGAGVRSGVSWVGRVQLEERELTAKRRRVMDAEEAWTQV